MGAYIINVPDTVDTIIYVNIGDVYDGKTHIASQRVEELTPYTEPDMEQAREEAYDKGYDDATAEIGSDEQAIAEKAYQRGLNDAREGKASCQYCRHTDKGSSEEPCKTCCMNYHNKFEPKEQITKGDIVRIKSTPEVEILVTYADEEYASGIAMTEVDSNCEIGDQYTDIRTCNVEKTGKHYDIVSVLAKMKQS